MNSDNLPWHQDYPQHNIELLSPELPAGSAWLVNCFLELGISVWEPWELKSHGEWKRVAKNQYQYISAQHTWKQTLPALKPGRTFCFDENLSCRASHRWAGTHQEEAKIILFVRDPRDMLFSQWRRNCHNQSDFNQPLKEFVQSNYHHFPCSHMDYLAYYLLLWQQSSKQKEIMIVRFEDYRINPFHTLSEVLNYLGVERSETAIQQAAKRSDFSVVKDIEAKMASKGDLKRKFNFAAKPYEYARLDNAVWSELCHPGLDQAIEWLGYEKMTSKTVVQTTTNNAQWINNMVECITDGATDSMYSHRVETLFNNLNKSQ